MNCFECKCHQDRSQESGTKMTTETKQTKLMTQSEKLAALVDKMKANAGHKVIWLCMTQRSAEAYCAGMKQFFASKSLKLASHNETQLVLDNKSQITFASATSKSFKAAQAEADTLVCDEAAFVDMELVKEVLTPHLVSRDAANCCRRD